ncbi:hypothetical protein PVT01_000107100 [Plasmodium vivax]|uniref:VIR protein n=1 Tax=Plasmodium vivax TaxID=5855 RepID=A0A1G4ED81_PLAVI|nr:hypothetical protein PVT01_000107100 [Plasmodium vivax]
MQPSGQNHKYAFFEEMNLTIMYKSMKSIKSNIEQGLSAEYISYIECDKISIEEKAKVVCKKFNNLINLLYSNRPKRVFLFFPNIYDYKYLSYWLLQEFMRNEIKFSDISENFYNNIKNSNNNFFSKESLKRVVENIQDMNFEEMEILYNLYENYSEIKTIISSGTQKVKGSCNQFSVKCHHFYELGIQKCSDNSSDLYKALHSFKESYESSFKFPGIGELCDSIKLNKLRSYDEIMKKEPIEFKTENDKRPWLRNTVNKKKIKNTINSEIHQLLNVDENNNININSGPYNVRYHSQ